MRAEKIAELDSVRRAALSGWFSQRPPAGTRILLTSPLGDGRSGRRPPIVVHTHD